jgi:hypothetical protein
LQTQPNSIHWYNPKRKKPFLQLKILRLIGKSGRLSKGMTEEVFKKDNHHHREILESFAALEKKSLISKMKYENPGIGKTLRRGRRRRYYQITDLGFSVLIGEGINAMEFWIIMANYCYYAKTADPNQIDSFYRSFLSYQLKYKSVIDNGYFISQLHIFDNMSKNWIRDKITTNDNEFSLSQKIIELLAISPGLTCNDVAHKINVPHRLVDMELKELAEESRDESFLIGDDEYYDTSTLREQMSDLLSHNLVKRTASHGQLKEDTLSLSLYGIMLLVKMIRLRNLNKIKRLYLFDDYSMQSAVDLIADGYKESLPLIFAEWDLLRRTLKILSIYNFDTIIGLKESDSDNVTSILLSGNKEYYDSITGIAYYSRKQLMNISSKGISVYSEFERKRGNAKIGAMYDKLIEIQGVLGYTDEFLAQSKLEESFANEISFYYFLNLNHDIFIPPLNAREYYEEVHTILSKDHDEFMSMEYDRYSLASPKRRLLDILDNSAVIRSAVMAWINDCVIFHRQTGIIIDKFFNEIRGRYMIRLLTSP